MIVCLTAYNLYLSKNITLAHIDKSYANIIQGRDFNDPYESRKELMTVAIKHMVHPKGILFLGDDWSRTNISAQASLAHISYYFHPTPVRVSKSEESSTYDYIISRGTFALRDYLSLRGESDLFQWLGDQGDMYQVVKRKEDLTP